MSSVLVGMSGGVDSTVTVYLLKEQGYDVQGVNFINTETDEFDRVRKIADRIGINVRSIDVKKEFEDRVIKDFVDEFKKGGTPNPCVFCNRVFKFELLNKLAKELDSNFIATGHYAIKQDGHLFRGKDKSKDQSYFLQRLTEELLQKAIFPLGKFTKVEVKKIAVDQGFDKLIQPVESQDLCFVKGDLWEYLKDRLPKYLFKPGKMVHFKTKAELDEHAGIVRYTIGQRAGVSGQKKPLFVHSLDAARNIVFVSEDSELYSDYLTLEDCSWISGKAPLANSDVLVQIRHMAVPVKARINIEGAFARINFSEPVRAVTPGQHAAIYCNTELLGGGMIFLSRKST